MHTACGYTVAIAKILKVSRFANFKHVKFLLREC